MRETMKRAGRRRNRREDRGSIHTSATRVSSVANEFIRVASLERTFLEVARSGLIEREISPQTNREVVMRKFLL